MRQNTANVDTDIEFLRMMRNSLNEYNERRIMNKYDPESFEISPHDMWRMLQIIDAQDLRILELHGDVNIYIESLARAHADKQHILKHKESTWCPQILFLIILLIGALLFLKFAF